MSNLEKILSDSRGRLLGIAYRMLGCRSEAEDVLQEAYLRLQAVDLNEVKSVEAYLITTVTRICLDQLKSARFRRERYVGPWLPEPIADADHLNPASTAELADDLSFALMLTLETLSAPERAAFILHDVFSLPFAQVAQTLGKSESACRQLAVRARNAIKSKRPSHRVKSEQHEKLLSQFVAAVGAGNTIELEKLLNADVVAYSDGGGMKAAALVPINGVDRVAKFFLGLKRKNERTSQQIRFTFAEINGLPGLLIYLNDQLDQTLSIEIEQGRIAAIYVVRNPLKLEQFLQPDRQAAVVKPPDFDRL